MSKQAPNLVRQFRLAIETDGGRKFAGMRPESLFAAYQDSLQMVESLKFDKVAGAATRAAILNRHQQLMRAAAFLGMDLRTHAAKVARERKGKAARRAA